MKILAALIITWAAFCNVANAIEEIDADDVRRFGPELLGREERVYACIRKIEVCTYNPGFMCASISKNFNDGCSSGSSIDQVMIPESQFNKLSAYQKKKLPYKAEPVLIEGTVRLAKSEGSKDIPTLIVRSFR